MSPSRRDESPAWGRRRYYWIKQHDLENGA